MLLDKRGGRKRVGRFDRFEAEIRQGIADKKTCKEILVEIGYPDADPEHLRRFLRHLGLKAANPKGARKGEKNNSWKGGRIADGNYIALCLPDHPHADTNGYVREHRWVMEQHLMRFLLPEKVVHHINGDTHDNRIENLQLFANNAEHLREMLKGKKPNWTEAGRDRIRQAVIASNQRRRKVAANPDSSETHDPA